MAGMAQKEIPNAPSKEQTKPTGPSKEQVESAAKSYQVFEKLLGKPILEEIIRVSLKEKVYPMAVLFVFSDRNSISPHSESGFLSFCHACRENRAGYYSKQLGEIAGKINEISNSLGINSANDPVLFSVAYNDKGGVMASLEGVGLPGWRAKYPKIAGREKALRIKEKLAPLEDLLTSIRYQTTVVEEKDGQPTLKHFEQKPEIHRFIIKKY